MEIQEHSRIHKIDARLKILTCAVYVVAVVTAPAGQWTRLWLPIVPFLAVLLMARVEIRQVLIRSAVVLPFSLLVAVFLPFVTEGQTVASFHLLWARVGVTGAGLEAMGEVVSKSWLSAFGLAILGSTTRPAELVAGLRRLRVPAAICSTLFLTIRYVTLLTDEVRQMERARRSRSAKPWYHWGIRSASGTVISLFLLACDTADQVHRAMVSRGFDGEIRGCGSHRPSLGAVSGCLLFAIVVVGIRIWA